MGRVAILQGPVAVKYSKIVNEPVADILNGIHDGWVAALLKTDAYKDPKVCFCAHFFPLFLLVGAACVWIL